MGRFSALLCLPALASAYFAPTCPPRTAVSSAAARACRPAMDETIMEKALSGELEQEGADNVFMSEVGWASYLDKQAGSSYNMNERPSKAQDGYFTPDVFSNPIDGASIRPAPTRICQAPRGSGGERGGAARRPPPFASWRASVPCICSAALSHDAPSQLQPASDALTFLVAVRVLRAQLP